MKKWVVKKNGKYLVEDDIDPVWSKNINKAIIYIGVKPILQDHKEECIEIVVSIFEKGK